MPNPRRAVQEKHEQFQVGLLVQELNRRHRARFSVVAEPNPPEAVIQSRRTTRWVEVVTAFWNEAYARDLYSYATPGEMHADIGSGPFMNMDQEFASKFVAVVKSKLEKKGYVPIREMYGLGYLLVSIHYPFLSSGTFRFIQEEWQSQTIKDFGCFRSVYITFRVPDGYRVARWRTG